MVFRPSLTEEQVPSGYLKGEGKRMNLREGALYSREGLGQFLSARIFKSVNYHKRETRSYLVNLPQCIKEKSYKFSFTCGNRHIGFSPNSLT